MATHQRFEVLGIAIDALDLDLAVAGISQRADRKEGGYVVFCTVSTILAARDLPAARKAVLEAPIVTPDGMPLVWLGRRRGHRDIGRVYGPDLMRAVLEATGDRYSHYFYGGTPEVLDAMLARLQRDYPGLRIAGRLAPGMLAEADPISPPDLEHIRAAGPDIVWVGLGHPKQDIWMHRATMHLDGAVLAGVGAAFDYLAGAKREAPAWIRRSGLQWLHRLLSEPGRLWRRYLVGNARFVWLLLTDRGRDGRGASG